MKIELRKWLSLISKKGHRLLIDVLPRGAGNFSHDPSLETFLEFFQTLPGAC